MDTNFGICEIPVLVYEYHKWYMQNTIFGTQIPILVYKNTTLSRHIPFMVCIKLGNTKIGMAFDKDF